jgi:hypothetical protein
VFKVSSNEFEPGETHEIMTVLQFPPNESFNILVNFESRYGTKKPFLALSPSALMQLAKASKD